MGVGVASCNSSSGLATEFIMTLPILNLLLVVQGDTKKWELLKNPTKIEEIQEKKIIDRN